MNDLILTRQQKVILYGHYICSGLAQKGLIESNIRITPDGRKMVAKILEDGFEITQEEIEWFIERALGTDKGDTG